MAGQAPLPITSKPKVFDVVGLPKKGEPGGRARRKKFGTGKMGK
jgi:hypothetical protein